MSTVHWFAIRISDRDHKKHSFQIHSFRNIGSRSKETNIPRSIYSYPGLFRSAVRAIATTQIVILSRGKLTYIPGNSPQVYDIEHAYGKKGHLKGQNSFSCASIINFPIPGSGVYHGCPFRVLEPAMLEQLMQYWGIPADSIARMKQKIEKGKHYQLACRE
jgi:hypothetical protein